MQLGLKIRARRQELGLSLRELADKVGLSTSFLSQVERELNHPSVDTLQKISEALEIPIFHFLIEPYIKSPVVRRDKRMRLTLPDSQFVYQLLTPDLNRKIQMFLTELEPGIDHQAIPLSQSTEECIYVLQGQMEIQLSDKVYLLGPGDSIYFEGLMFRRLVVRGDQTLRYIAAITPPIF
ncbi:MAG: helix-turn-helix domain-containing protein [Chloroflexi bacterium]|nr:helix-turn-helix domain-containing protein [Chloroflexota bacterium]